MKTGMSILGVALILAAGGAAARDATPADIRKPIVDPAKRERRFAAPGMVNQSDAWQPYLRWHRDAISLQGQADRPYIQL
jgi:hypothetical protein